MLFKEYDIVSYYVGYLMIRLRHHGIYILTMSVDPKARGVFIGEVTETYVGSEQEIFDIMPAAYRLSS